jgi:hypothetical protein
MSSKIKGGKIVSRDKTILSRENLETFKIKSKFFIPGCFGGYDPKDPVCKNFCWRARQNSLDDGARQVEAELNEGSHSYGSFFYRDFKFQSSCEYKRKEIEGRLEEVAKRIKNQLSDFQHQRVLRDSCFLAEGSEGLKRIPIGEVKDTEDFSDFSKALVLYLETQDTRLFSHPYGPMYDSAVGKIWELIPGGAGPEDSEVIWGYVKSITPKLPDAWNYRLKILNQKPDEAGNLVVSAKIEYESSSTEFMDIYGVVGQEVAIEVFGDSAKRYVRVDDIGKL